MADWIWQYRRHHLRLCLFDKGCPVIQVRISDTVGVPLFGGLELDTLSRESLVGRMGGQRNPQTLLMMMKPGSAEDN